MLPSEKGVLFTVLGVFAIFLFFLGMVIGTSNAYQHYTIKELKQLLVDREKGLNEKQEKIKKQLEELKEK